jgi:regulator of replication initiation timing
MNTDELESLKSDINRLIRAETERVKSNDYLFKLFIDLAEDIGRLRKQIDELSASNARLLLENNDLKVLLTLFSKRLATLEKEVLKPIDNELK